MKHATDIQCVASLSTNDPLVVAVLGYLPSITALGSSSQWPASFATFMERKSARYRYVAFRLLSGEQSGCSSAPQCFHLCGAFQQEGHRKAVILRPAPLCSPHISAHSATSIRRC